jgi:hypothetical protein
VPVELVDRLVHQVRAVWEQPAEPADVSPQCLGGTVVELRDQCLERGMPLKSLEQQRH